LPKEDQLHQFEFHKTIIVVSQISLVFLLLHQLLIFKLHRH